MPVPTVAPSIVYFSLDYREYETGHWGAIENTQSWHLETDASKRDAPVYLVFRRTYHDTSHANYKLEVPELRRYRLDKQALLDFCKKNGVEEKEEKPKAE